MFERHPEPDTNELAGVLDRRLEAVLIDGLLVVLVTAVLAYAAGTLFLDGGLAALGGAMLAIVYVTPVVTLLYFAVFEGYYGRTLGKAARGLVVVNTNGGAVGWSGSIVRNVVRIADALPGFYLVGVVVAYATDRNQRIGDLLGKTIVVHTAN